MILDAISIFRSLKDSDYVMESAFVLRIFSLERWRRESYSQSW